jgi:AcrR family transcriptional regulator
MSTRRTNIERSRRTRADVVRASRRLFAERGYRATSLADIAAAAGVTTGAIYHHWSGKPALLAAVVEHLYRELAARIAGDRASSDTLRIGMTEFLELCAEPGVGRLLVLDAPAVLGLDAWQRIDERWWLAPTRDALAAAGVAAEETHLTAVALLGALTALGREVARTPNRPTQRRAIARIELLLATAGLPARP